MRKILVSLAVFALFAWPAGALGQASESMHEEGPPKVLQIIREESKPGKAIAHRAHEAAWMKAVYKADPKSPPMLVMSSVSGDDEDWFILGYDNFAQFEKASDSLASGPAAAVMASYSPKETDFVSESRTILAKYRPDLSYKPQFKVGEYRYFNVLTVRYKLGSGPEDVHKVVQAAREKANPDYHQAVYEVTSGMPVNTFLYFTQVKSLTAWDEPPNKEYGAALKEGGFMDSVGKTVQTVDTRLFAFSPSMSHLPESVTKLNPSFWNPKTEMAKTSAASTKPAAKKEAKTEKK
jgi:hypothetical protein